MTQHSKKGGHGRGSRKPAAAAAAASAAGDAKDEAKEESPQKGNPLSLSRAALNRTKRTPERAGYKYALGDLLALRKAGERYPGWASIPAEVKVRGGAQAQQAAPQADGGRAGSGHGFGWQPIGGKAPVSGVARRSGGGEGFTLLRGEEADVDTDADEPAAPPSLLPTEDDGSAREVSASPTPAGDDIEPPMPSLETQDESPTAAAADREDSERRTIEADMELLLNNSNVGATDDAEDAAVEGVLQQAGVMNATPVRSTAPLALHDEDAVMATILTEVAHANAAGGAREGMPQLEEMDGGDNAAGTTATGAANILSTPATGPAAFSPARKAMLDMSGAPPASPWRDDVCTPARSSHSTSPPQRDLATPNAAPGRFLFNRTPMSAGLGSSTAHIHTPSAKEKAIWAAPPASAPPKPYGAERSTDDGPPQLLPPGYEPPRELDVVARARAAAFTPNAKARGVDAATSPAAPTPLHTTSPLHPAGAARASPASSIGYKNSLTPPAGTNAYAQAAANVAQAGGMGDATPSPAPRAVGTPGDVSGAQGLSSMKQAESQQAMLRLQALRSQQEKLMQSQTDLIRQIHFQQQAAAADMSSMYHRMGGLPPHMPGMPTMAGTPWLP